MKIKPYSLFFITVSFAFLFQAKDYPMGTLSTIQYGFFPIVASVILIILAIWSCFIKND